MEVKAVASFTLLAAIAAAGASLTSCSNAPTKSVERVMPAPSLDNNPQFDMILTNPRPILSANNPTGLQGKYTLTCQISADPQFSEGSTISYSGIEPNSCYSLRTWHACSRSGSSPARQSLGNR